VPSNLISFQWAAILAPMQSGMRSGLMLLIGYSVAGAESNVLVKGLGARMVGSSLNSATGSIFL
jgi:uncharacterized protein (DUF697 family)